MNNEEEAAVSAPSEEEWYAQVPSDFPRPVHMGAIGGAQPKVLMVKYNDRFYSSGCTPPELYERWDICEDLARQLSTKSLESKAGKRADMSEVEILAQYLPRLIATKWTSEPEARYIIRRTAAMLGWPVPTAATEPGAEPNSA